MAAVVIRADGTREELGELARYETPATPARNELAPAPSSMTDR